MIQKIKLYNIRRFKLAAVKVSTIQKVAVENPYYKGQSSSFVGDVWKHASSQIKGNFNWAAVCGIFQSSYMNLKSIFVILS